MESHQPTLTAYIQSQNDVRLQKIERHNRIVSDQQLKKGDIVQYFRRGSNSNEAWKGPVRLIAFDRTIELIRHGAKIIKAHQQHQRKFRSDESCENSWDEETDKQTMTNGGENNHDNGNQQTFSNKR